VQRLPAVENSLQKELPLFPIKKSNEDYEHNIYILIDIENKPNTKLIDKYCGKYSNINIIKFVGKQHSNRKLGNIIVDSMYRDAADHAISFYIGGIVASVSGNITIIIYTGDRFASAVKEFCKFPGIKVEHMAHSEDIIQYLSNNFQVIKDNENTILC